MNIKIFGLGWYGLPLAQSLQKKGHHVCGSVTTADKAAELKQKNIEAEVVKFPDIPKKIDSDILILNIPPFAEELEWFKSWNISQETWIIFISSTSVLSKTDDKLRLQEEWIRTHQNWSILRFGGLYGGERHPGKSLSGRKNLAGRLWPVNLLHLIDAVGFTEVVIEKKLMSEIYNVLSDDHPTREAYYSEYCRIHKLPLPEFDPKDDSVKAAIDNSEARKIYSFSRLTY